jgi:predicted DsbA family dithiol-disulfide isomerase
MLIDIYHDTVCPWCRIGKKHLFEALSGTHQKEVNIRWHPFLLDNTVPSEGYEFRDFMQKRKGMTPEQLQQLFDFTHKAGIAAGVALDFDKVRWAVNTMLSHQLIALAPAEIKSNVVEAIYQAYFEDGLNIGNVDVLKNIATQLNIDIELLQLQNQIGLDQIIAESQFARLNGINSVPFFVINNSVQVDGSHSPDIFIQAFNRASLINI